MYTWNHCKCIPMSMYWKRREIYRKNNRSVRGFISVLCICSGFCYFSTIFFLFFKNIPWMTFKTCCRFVSYYSKLNWYNITCWVYYYGIFDFSANCDSSFYYTRHIDVITYYFLVDGFSIAAFRLNVLL